MRKYKVTYNIGYGCDNYAISGSSNTVDIEAQNKKEAREKAIKWANDNDYRTEGDYIVRVLTIEAVPSGV